MTLDLYGEYVGRENTLPEALADNVTKEEAKTRGWNTYYDAHKGFLDGDGTEKNQGEWIPPGSKAAYLCQKKKEQRICKRMKNCGDNIPKDKNGKSYPNVKCAWCPATGSGVPAKTGKPKIPSNKYKLIVSKPIFGPRAIPKNKTTKVCIVIGTG